MNGGGNDSRSGQRSTTSDSADATNGNRHAVTFAFQHRIWHQQLATRGAGNSANTISTAGNGRQALRQIRTNAETEKENPV